ncbi:uncharacterized protein MYCFIDRAFT_199100 [Pseudocercospora fijiensis CIRAD86]|uniref:F-box domain-containing protein n=1 Tax=Pseudocercospora fijiensis (strain CIRAD86) TaxID=383855 RepID=M3AQD7_PSEFD|nr:uncharacterized protein MYCFIDRAFT_199100 [Pseudocercospora fijiensis CIRAD86]EME79293.1 hypothetical protein MYCFIDRAFT_199100 [Pseudocercospora fijiensis CIRAD86]
MRLHFEKEDSDAVVRTRAFDAAKSGPYDPGQIQVFYDNRTFAGPEDKLPFYQRYKLDALSRLGRADTWIPQDLEPGKIRLVWYTHVGNEGKRDFLLHKWEAVKEMFDSLSQEGFRPMICGYSNENPFPMLGGVEPPPPPKKAEKKEPKKAKTWSNHVAGHVEGSTPHDRVMAIIQADEKREAELREIQAREWKDVKKVNDEEGGLAEKEKLIAAAHSARRKREEHNQQTFGFLKLPTELRNIIYDLVLGHDQVIWPGRQLNAPLIREENNTIYLNLIAPALNGDAPIALAQVTRLIRAEVLRYHYGSNTYILSIHDDLIGRTTSWIRSRPPEAFTVLERVILQDWSFTRCPQLLDLSIECPCCILVFGLNLHNMAIDFPTLGIEDASNAAPVLKAGLCEWCQVRTKKVLRKRKKHIVYRRLVKGWDEQGLCGERIVQLVRWWKEYSKIRPQARLNHFAELGLEVVDKR